MYYQFDEDSRKFSVSYGALENEVGEWLIKLIQKAIHNHSRQQEKQQHKQIKEQQEDVVGQNDQLQMIQQQTIKQELLHQQDQQQDQYQDQMMDDEDEGQIMDLEYKADADSKIIKEQDEIYDNNSN